MRDEDFEKELAGLTEADAGFQNWRDDLARRGMPESICPRTLETYRGFRRMWERDTRQMIDQGR